jgi:hypothetical protein
MLKVYVCRNSWLPGSKISLQARKSWVGRVRWSQWVLYSPFHMQRTRLTLTTTDTLDHQQSMTHLYTDAHAEEKAVQLCHSTHSVDGSPKTGRAEAMAHIPEPASRVPPMAE